MNSDNTAIGPPADDEIVGKTIDSFRIEALLGAGGMGRVYKAYDTSLFRRVALKIVAPGLATPEFLTRFEREARALAAVNHSNIAHVYSIGRYEGRPYYTMELIDGESLGAILERGKVPGKRAVKLLHQAAEGLRAAHEAGIIHRDIKPSNLMLDANDHLKIVDFGLARWTEEAVSLTPTAMALGTPRYIAPEQAKGLKCDHRADIYSLGASFYHVFSGSPPFEADTPFGLLMQHANTPLRPLKERTPSVPVAIASIVDRMMAKLPEQRYASYDALIADIETALLTTTRSDAPTTRTPISLPAPPPPPAEASGWKIGAAVVGTAIIAIWVAVFIHLKNKPAPPPAEAIKIPTLQVPADDEGQPMLPGVSPDTPLANVPLNSRTLIGMAQRAQTLAKMQKLMIAVESMKAEEGLCPPSLGEIVQRYEIPAVELVDGWRRELSYSCDGEQSYQIMSGGADGIFGNDDDLLIENGLVTKGGAEFQPPSGAIGQ